MTWSKKDLKEFVKRLGPAWAKLDDFFGGDFAQDVEVHF